MKRVVHHATPDEALSSSTASHYVSLSDPINPKRIASHDKELLLPPLVPESIWSRDSRAIPLTYISTGLMYAFPQAIIEFFPRALDASDAQLNTIAVVRALPWTFKVLFGLLPDAFPIHDQRFTPYLGTGCLIASFFHVVLSMASASNALGIISFTFLLFGATIGVVMADVMADALVAHRVLQMKQKPPRTNATELQQDQPRPQSDLQTIVYLCRFGSEIVGYWLGAIFSNANGTAAMVHQFAFLALVPLVVVLPALTAFSEPKGPPPLSWRDQVAGLWRMLQRRATWQPVTYLILVNLFIVPNAAWGNYLKVAYHFTPFQYGALSAMGTSVTFVAIALYRTHILPHCNAPYHKVYYATSSVVTLFSLANVLLVWHVNDKLGLSPFLFAMGDAAGTSFARGFQYLPVAQLFVTVCPVHQEGVAFALLTSVTNLAQAMATTIANMLLALWPVDLPDLAKIPHDFHGVWKLSILTSFLPLVPVLGLTRRLLPTGPDHQEEMIQEMSPSGAALVVGMYIVGFLWVTSLSLVAIVAPCHVLVGGHGC